MLEEFVEINYLFPTSIRLLPVLSEYSALSCPPGLKREKLPHLIRGQDDLESSLREKNGICGLMERRPTMKVSSVFSS